MSDIIYKTVMAKSPNNAYESNIKRSIGKVLFRLNDGGG